MSPILAKNWMEWKYVNIFLRTLLIPGILPIMCLIVLNTKIYHYITGLKSALQSKEGRIVKQPASHESFLLMEGEIYLMAIWLNWLKWSEKNSYEIVSLISGTKFKKFVVKRIAQQKKELSLAVILSFTVLMFLITHAPR